jgi:hypothetical protein
VTPTAGKQDLANSIDVIRQIMDIKGYLQSCAHLVAAELVGSASDMPGWEGSIIVPQVSALQTCEAKVDAWSCSHHTDPCKTRTHMISAFAGRTLRTSSCA